MPQFDSSAFWGIAGIVIGVVVATFFFIIGKKKVLLQYDISTTPLITETMAGILHGRMTIDGQPVKSMYSTTISFVNSGNQRIQSSDFSVQKPLTIIHNSHLYGFDVSRGNQKLLPKVEPVSKDALNISFENLKPGQIFRVTILHDDDDTMIQVLGELMTGTMRSYGSSLLLLFFALISLFIAFFLLYDRASDGPVFALIGNFELLLAAILFILTMLVYATDIYKELKVKKHSIFSIFNVTP